MATSNFIYLSVGPVLEKQNHCADFLGICKVSGRTFFPSAMSLGYMLTCIKHCTPQIIFLAEADLNLRGQMSL